jgi:5-methyltetrahydropteroyltriglutamate--homocysteine methyltransferase
MRPAALLEARRQLNAGAITRSELQVVENDAIREVVAMQERVGIRSVTDGEFRRNSWRDNFFERTDGYSRDKVESSFFFTEFDGTIHRGSSAPVPVGRLRRRDPITCDDFAALAPLVTRGTPKATIPSPTVNHFFTGDLGLAQGSYRGDRETYFADIAAIYRQEVKDLYAAGCRYLQVDEVPLAILCDPRNQAIVRQRGEDPDELIEQYGSLISSVVEDRASDMTVVVHMCRGNSGHGLASGGYDVLAEPIFARLPVDGYLLEYDTARAGGYEPLRAIAGVVALGLISTKLATLEPVDEIQRKIDAAARFVPLERLALCPQCGFASAAGVTIDVAGVGAGAGGAARAQRMSFDEQERKLAHVVEVAARIWS